MHWIFILLFLMIIVVFMIIIFVIVTSFNTFGVVSCASCIIVHPVAAKLD